MPLNSLDYKPFKIPTLAGGLETGVRTSLIPPTSWAVAKRFVVDLEEARKVRGFERFVENILSPEYQDYIDAGAVYVLFQNLLGQGVFNMQGSAAAGDVWQRGATPSEATQWEFRAKQDADGDYASGQDDNVDTPAAGALQVLTDPYTGKAIGDLLDFVPTTTANQKLAYLQRRITPLVGSAQQTCPIVLLHHVSFDAVTNELYLFTHRDIYQYDQVAPGAAGHSERRTPVYTTGTATVLGGTPTIVNGTATSWVTGGILVDQLFKFDDDPDTAWTRILTVDGELQLTLVQNYKGTVHAAPSAYTIIETYLGGIDLDTAKKQYRWSAATFNSGLPERLVVAVNGFNRVQKHNGNIGTKFSDLGGLTAIPETPAVNVSTARAVMVVSESVCLGATTENGTFYERRVRWSDPRDAEGWSASKWRDLDGEDEIQGAAQLERTGVWFTTRGIHNQQFLATPADFAFDRRVNGLGCIAPGSIQVVPRQAIIFLGNDDIYQYDLVRPTRIGRAVEESIFADVDDEYLLMATSFYDEISSLYLLSYPTSDGNQLFNSRTLALDLKRGRWLEPYEGFMAFSRYFQGATIPFVDDVDDIIDTYDRFFDERGSVGTPLILGADAYGGVHQLFTGGSEDFRDMRASFLTGMTNLGQDGIKRLGWVVLRGFESGDEIEFWLGLSRNAREVHTWVGPLSHTLSSSGDDFEKIITIDRSANYFTFAVVANGRDQDIRLHSMDCFYRLEGRSA